MNADLERLLVPSEDVVAREIEGELIIIPLVAGIGDMEDELFTLNDTGKAIWKLLDGRNTLKAVASTLAQEYGLSVAEIEGDVLGLMEELISRRIVREVAGIR